MRKLPYKLHLCRLYAMGVITTKKSLVQLEKLSTASFCRRRLAVVLVRLKMSETMKEACTFIEQVQPFQPKSPSVFSWLPLPLLACCV